jgi:hypothetical protein
MLSSTQTGLLVRCDDWPRVSIASCRPMVMQDVIIANTAIHVLILYSFGGSGFVIHDACWRY